MEREQISQLRLLPTPVGQENCGDRFCITPLHQKVRKGGFSKIKIIPSEAQKKTVRGFDSPCNPIGRGGRQMGGGWRKEHMS